ncbi:MAG TPA: aldo/keto reductase [Terriglobales bacterium]|nr:aldo/keto reductase [Terriglobales bacterium]
MSLAQAVPSISQVKVPLRAISAPNAEYNISVGYLRASIAVLVVAHHTALAYAAFAPPVAPSLTAPPRWWQAFPIVDSQKWAGAATIVRFNDTFFMSLMFFISGLFVWKSLQRKGTGAFMRDRSLRLGIPFVASFALLAPLAYYAAYLQIGQHGIGNFTHQWLSLGILPAGPAWFVWLLLAFDFVAAEMYFSMPHWAEVAGRVFARFANKPVRFLGSLIVMSAAVYIPMAMKFSGLSWTQFGPFAFQTARLLHYFVYFLTGVAVGAYGIERGILASGGKLARRSWLWWIAAIVVFLASSAFFIIILTTPMGASTSWQIIANLVFTITCATTSMAMLALFVRFVKKSRGIFDSLRNNAYGIYLLHYIFVVWLQYALLKAHLSGFSKLTIVFSAALALSWITTAALRRIPAVAPHRLTFCRDETVRYIACSNFSGWHLMKSLTISDKFGWPRYIAHQAYYSLIGRDFEWELMPLALDQKVGTIVWSPLGWGRLTGKIRRGQPRPEVSRLPETSYKSPPVQDEYLYKVVDVLDEIARESGKTIPQIALNWLLQRPTVASVIIGARNEEQLRQNLAAFGWNLTAEQIARLDATSEMTPAYPYWHQRQFDRNPKPV